jgi:hypothetical protein
MKKIIGIVFVGALLALVGSFIFFLHVGLFRVLGIHYESTSVLVKFLVGSFLVEVLVIIVGTILKVILARYMSIAVDRKVKWFLTVMVDWLGIHFVDEWLNGIVIATWTEFALAVIFLILNIMFDDSEKK